MDMTRTAGSDPIDFDGWVFCGGRCDEAIAKDIAKSLEDQFNEDGISISAPFEWGPDEDGSNGPAVDNPLTFYVTIPLSSHNGVTYSFSLQDFLKNCFDEWNGEFSDRDREIRTKVVDSLESLAAALRLRLAEKLTSE